MAGKTTM